MKKLFRSIVALASAALTAAAETAHAAVFAHMGKSGLILFAMDQVPSAADFNSRRVTNASQSEVIRQRFYDYNLYPAAGVGQMAFFSQAIGQGITSSAGAVVGSAKSPHDTNLVLPNTLPSGNGFMIESIEALFVPGAVTTANTYTPAAIAVFAAVASAAVYASVNDVNTIYQSGLLELSVLNKIYLSEAPLLAFPPKAHFDVSAAIASNSATVSTVGIAFAKASGRPYYLSPEVTLQPAVNFSVTVRWPGVVATPSGFNGRLGIILDGYFMRASQ